MPSTHSLNQYLTPEALPHRHVPRMPALPVPGAGSIVKIIYWPITELKMSCSSPKQVKSTHSLLEGKAHLPGDEFLIIAKDNWIADLFPLTVPFHLAIQSR